jgi:hypothetical protein
MISFARAERDITKPAFVVDQASIVRDTGRQIDWSLVTGDDYGADTIPDPQGKYIEAGTVVDLLTNGKVVPSALGTGGVTAYGILETRAEEMNRNDAASGYGVICSAFIYENLLPEDDISAFKSELLDRGGFWMFTDHEDTTA